MPSRSHTRPRSRAARRALLTGLAVLAACSSDATGPAGGIESDGPITVVAPTSAVAPYQVTSITVRGGKLTGDGYSGSLGGLEILAGRVDDSTVALIVPGATPPGAQPLRLRIGRADATATLQVSTAVGMPDAAAYLSGVDSLFRGRVMEALAAADAFASTGSPAADPAAMFADRQLALTALDQARALFDELTPEEQREAANIVLATYGVAARGSAGASGSRSPALRAQMADPGDDLDPAVCRYKDLPLSVGETEYCEQLTQRKVGFWQTDTEQCAADAQKAAQRGIRPRIRNFLWQVVNGCHYASLSAWAAETWASIEFPTLPEFDLARQFEEFDPLEPFNPGESRVAGAASAGGPASLSRTASSTAAAPIFFSPGTPTTLTPRVRFRAMTTGDVGKVPAATEKAQRLNALAASWQKFNAAVGTGLTQKPPTMNDVTATTPRQLRYPASRLRLGAITPATVRGTASVVNGQWTVTFDADEQAADTPFTFDVIYDGGKYGADTMTVSAMLGGLPNRYTGTFTGEGVANSYNGDGTFACQWYYTITDAAVTAVYGPAAASGADRTITFTVAGTYKRDPMHGSRENPSCPAGTGSFSEVVTGTATGPSRSFDLTERRLLDWPTTHWRGRTFPGPNHRLGVSIRLSGFGGVIYETGLELAPAAGP